MFLVIMCPCGNRFKKEVGEKGVWKEMVVCDECERKWKLIWQEYEALSANG